MAGKFLLIVLGGLILAGCASDQQGTGTGSNSDPRFGTLNASVFEGGPPVGPAPTTTGEYLANGQIPASLSVKTSENNFRWNALVYNSIPSKLSLKMKPYGQALLDYHRTEVDSMLVFDRDDGFKANIPIGSFFDDVHFSELEQRALNLCRGKVLDIGAGVGRHALELQRRGLEVCAIDILPEAVYVMKERGVHEALPYDVMTMEDRTFDTLLMLMNGIGIVGTPSELDRFLSHAAHMLNEGGSLLCDSLDTSRTIDPMHVRYREKNVRKGRYPGQEFYTAKYGNAASSLFPWLHLDFATLEKHARSNNWKAELIFAREDGHYLARLTKTT